MCPTRPWLWRPGTSIVGRREDAWKTKLSSCIPVLMVADEQASIGARIAEARRHAGLTQRQLADYLAVTVRTIQNYEAGVTVPYRYLRTIESLAHKRPGWILEGGEDIDLAKTISKLHEAMERHHLLMQRHLEEMRLQTDRLRDQRRLSAQRRRAP